MRLCLGSINPPTVSTAGPYDQSFVSFLIVIFYLSPRELYKLLFMAPSHDDYLRLDGWPIEVKFLLIT